MFGAPVNRIRITGYWASRSLATRPYISFGARIREYVRYTTFLSVMFSIDIAFWTTKFRQWILQKVGVQSPSFEDELEKTMRGFAESNLGLRISPSAFEG